MSQRIQDFAWHCADLLQREDPDLYALVSGELERQTTTLAMVASCSIAHPSVLACEGTFTSNVTAEGYPGKRFHAGCEYVDQFEQLAIDRAKVAFGARYANVQPHSASTANQIVMGALLKPGDTLLGLSLDAGGHLSHGSPVNVSGQFFNAIGYGLDTDGFIDFDRTRELAREHNPKLIICGTTAYPRRIDWSRFRDIADEVGAYLLADITHIAGLVIAGEHPNPIDDAHVTVTCTHKQLYGPRGGLILIGKDFDSPGPGGKGTLAQAMQRGVFPFMQGAPLINNIVAKARALHRAMTPEFREVSRRIVALSQALADEMVRRDVRIVSGGTDNHIVLADVLHSFGVTGLVAEKALESCRIVVNKNHIFGDRKSPLVTSGIRIGANALAARGFDTQAMRRTADLMCRILAAVEPEGDRAYRLDGSLRARFQAEVKALCREFPIPGYDPLPQGMGHNAPGRTAPARSAAPAGAQAAGIPAHEQ
jgi:glycine hydroxymethyltransferase